MYSQFLFFIIAIFICSIYQPEENPAFSFFSNLFFFILLCIAFAGSTWLKFSKIKRDMAHQTISALDRRFNDAVTYQTIFAVIMLGLSLFAFHVTDFLYDVKLFAVIPTLPAVSGVMIFFLFLSIIWKFSHSLYQQIYHNPLSLRDYMASNLSFAVPVVLPWLLLSITADLLNLIPLGSLKQFFSSTQGEIVFFIFFLFVIAATGPFFIQKLWRCKPLNDGYPRNRIQELCKRAGLEVRDILYWPLFGGKMVTAGIMGLVKVFRYILITPSLIRLLSPEELDAVVAHEIGHIKKKHLLLYLILLAGFFIIAHAGFQVITYLVILFPNSLEVILETGLKAPAGFSVLFNLFFVLSFIVYFRYVFGFFMRNFERQADTYVYQLFGSARPLMTTLNKIAASSGLSADRPNWHHFSIKERVEFLEKCEFSKTWIHRHDQKVKAGLAAYLAALLLIGGVEMGMARVGYEDKFRTALYESAILTELKASPRDPLLYGLLGDLYQENKQYQKALTSYDTSLYLSPTNPVVLNNLAWMLATCPDKEVRDPGRALALAQKASAIDQKAHILDTLAECYYVNGLFKQAAVTGQQALDLSEENRSYYKKQLEKFKSAVKKIEAPLEGIHKLI